MTLKASLNVSSSWSACGCPCLFLSPYLFPSLYLSHVLSHVLSPSPSPSLFPFPSHALFPALALSPSLPVHHRRNPTDEKKRRKTEVKSQLM